MWSCTVHLTKSVSAVSYISQVEVYLTNFKDNLSREIAKWLVIFNLSFSVIFT